MGAPCHGRRRETSAGDGVIVRRGSAAATAGDALIHREASMQYRKLGNSTQSISAVGLGCMSMSGIYGKGDDAESITVVHRALDLGINFIDSSDMYGWGHNEELLGRALKGRSEEHTSELQSLRHLVCRLLLEKKK